MKTFLNIHTGETITRQAPKETEIPFDGQMLIVEMDASKTITFTNKKFREMVGYEREELVGTPFAISHHPDVPPIMCEQAFNTASLGKIWAGYIKSITQNGEYFWSSICVQPKFDLDKNIIGFIINLKKADKEIIKGVQDEYSKLKLNWTTDFRSEYCGELHLIQNR